MSKLQTQPREVYLDKNARRLSRTNMDNPCSNSDIEEVCTKVSLCCCQQSKHYPMCDGTHELFNKQTNSNVQPIIVEVDTNGLIINQTKKRNSRRISTDTTNLLSSQEVIKTSQTEEIKEVETQTTETQSSLENQKKELVIRRVDKSKITAIYTEEEVATHNTRDDCWMIIKGNVYDITAYFPYHPGSDRALLRFAGKDGTENVQFHSPKMMQLLDTYFYIGKLKGAKSQSSCIIS